MTICSNCYTILHRRKDNVLSVKKIRAIFEKIRTRLHKGNAVVVVGIGFSLNAMRPLKAKGPFTTAPPARCLENKLYLKLKQETIKDVPIILFKIRGRL